MLKTKFENCDELEKIYKEYTCDRIMDIFCNYLFEFLPIFLFHLEPYFFFDPSRVHDSIKRQLTTTIEIDNLFSIW